MKVRFSIALLLTLLTLPALADDLTGTWKGQLTDNMGAHPIVLQLKAEGSAITGTLTGGPPTGGEEPLTNVRLKGDQLSFTIKAQGPDGDLVLVFKGKVSGNHIKGTHEAPFGAVPWEVTKE